MTTFFYQVSEGAWIGAPAVGGAVRGEAARLSAIADLVRTAREKVADGSARELHAARQCVTVGIAELQGLETLACSACKERDVAARALRRALTARTGLEEELARARAAGNKRRAALVAKAEGALYSAESDIFSAEDLRRRADERLRQVRRPTPKAHHHAHTVLTPLPPGPAPRRGGPDSASGG